MTDPVQQPHPDEPGEATATEQALPEQPAPDAVEPAQPELVAPEAPAPEAAAPEAAAPESPAPRRRTARAVKVDAVLAGATELARGVAEEAAEGFGVGEHLAVTAEADRVVTHWFACSHPGYRGWRWSVTLSRASRGRTVTMNEVVLLPGPESLEVPAWLPWEERIQGGDLTPGTLLATPDNDPRLEPGFTAGATEDMEPAEASQVRAVVAELGLGRERVLSAEGRDLAAERWLAGDGGPDNELSRQAPGKCGSCGYFARLQGSLGVIFGACTNEYSPSDATVVSVDHGCGGHSDVVEEKRGVELPEPVWDTVAIGEGLFD